MSHSHLSDDRLIEIYFDLDVTATDRAHLQDCDACRARRSNLAETLDDVDVVMTQEADAAFPADRLSRQRARIVQRVDQDGRPARVIAFPAVAASFLVGLLAEHLAHDIPGSRQSMPATRAQASLPTTQVRANVSDDELLGQVELAASGVGPAALRPLDALTPRAWDAR